jgi:hypothetical protein
MAPDVSHVARPQLPQTVVTADDPSRSLGVQGTSSPVGSAEETEGVVHGNLATDVIHSGDRTPPGVGNARRLEERTG